MNRIDVNALMVPMSDAVRFDRQTTITHGSPEWYAQRVGRKIGSSEAGSVFQGISSSSARRDLINKFNGINKPKPDSYSQWVMDQGTKMEPVLLHELTAIMVILRANLYVSETLLYGGIIEGSTPDGIGLSPHYPHGLCIVEIKWRTLSYYDCGWGELGEDLGLSQWCQVQHQMHITGIHKAVLYAGCKNGARRLWSIRYSEVFRKHYLLGLEHCVNDTRFWTGPEAIAILTPIMLHTTKLEYVRAARQGIGETKTEDQVTEGGAEGTEEFGECEETLDEDC